MAAKTNGKAESKFDPKWIEGLTYRTTEIKKTKGEPDRRVPVERELTEAEVLDWNLVGDEVVIATADGRKYRVKK